jgi:hypothetical protein
MQVCLEELPSPADIFLANMFLQIFFSLGRIFFSFFGVTAGIEPSELYVRRTWHCGLRPRGHNQ